MCSLFIGEFNLRNLKSARPTLLIVVIDHPPRRDQRCRLIAGHELAHPLILPLHSTMNTGRLIYDRTPNSKQNYIEFKLWAQARR
jgi:hypothetical protein